MVEEQSEFKERSQSHKWTEQVLITPCRGTRSPVFPIHIFEVPSFSRVYGTLKLEFCLRPTLTKSQLLTESGLKEVKTFLDEGEETS